MSAARVFYSLNRRAVSKLPRQGFGPTFADNFQLRPRAISAPKNILGRQIGNMSALISHDIGSLRHSLNEKILETRPCKNPVETIVKAMRRQRAIKRSRTIG